MGYCDPKAIRNGNAWADVVNKPGFMNPPAQTRTFAKKQPLKNQALAQAKKPCP